MSLRAMVAVALCLGLSAPVATAAADHETTAAVSEAELSSGGDPYFPLDGNHGYDVKHYRIQNTYDPDTDRLAGTTRVRARATEALDRFSLDLVLAVDRVLVDGRVAEFTEPHRHELLVDPEGVLAPGETFTVEVSYHGRPSSVDAVGVSPGVDLYFHRSGETIAMGEPQNGAWWFAANEVPRDKATFDVTIRVPRGVEAVSNGGLVDRDAGERWTSWRWRLDEPVATYMAFFAAGQFRLDQGSVLDADGGGLEFAYAVSRNLATDEQRTAMRKLRMTAEVVEWLEGQLGDYPYGEIGGLVTSIPSGYALETATRPVYPWSATQGRGWKTLLVHEQAHQWFGNDVAVERWRDIWLNEGFATYVEWWYDEDRGGETVAERLDGRYHMTPSMASFWDVRISDPGPSQMFSNPIYVRGAMTLAALRARIGDADFATLLDQWLARHRNGHGTGTEFRSLAGEVSGEDLTGFFQHWLDDQVRPAETAENGLR